MNNTIILKKGYELLGKKEYEKFEKGNTIYGDGSDPEEIKRWPIEEKDEALDELKKYRCEYRKLREAIDITEYALEFCRCDEDGEFIDGSDYEFAEEI